MNKGYEDRANRHPGVPPAVYDTAQTGKRGAAKGQPVAEYAVVDKSKKKPRVCI